MKPAPPAEPTNAPSRRLPDERVSPARPSEIAWLVITPIVIALLLNLAIARVLGAHTTNRGYAITQLKWDMLDGLSHKVDTLVVGDSSCNQGIRPDVLAHELGGTAINLCTTGDSIAVGPAWMVGAYVERFGAPRRVILMHAYDIWKRNDDKLRRHAWIFGRHRDLFLGRAPELEWSAHERALLYVGEPLPLYSQPSAARAVLWDLGRAPAQKEFKIEPDGFMRTSKARPATVKKDARRHVRRNGNRKPAISKQNRAAVSELARLSTEHGFSLFVVHGPMFEGVWANEGVRRYHGGLSDALERLLAPAPRARLLFRSPMTFSGHSMSNVDHVVGRAAKDFSARLVHEIEQVEREFTARR
jgi:hypothetical protein